VRILAKRGVLQPFALPDISTKEKAQKHIRFDVAKAQTEKAAFLRDVVPAWDATARTRESEYPKQ